MALWKRRRDWPLVWIGVVFASSALYWLLRYGAVRALYGSHLLLFAFGIWLAVTLSSDLPRRRIWVGGALAVLLAVYLAQHGAILRIKQHNAAVLAAREQILAQRLQACAAQQSRPCVVEHGPLEQGLRRDWVLHPDYQGDFLAWMRLRYAPDAEVRFEARGVW